MGMIYSSKVPGLWSDGFEQVYLYIEVCEINALLWSELTPVERRFLKVLCCVQSELRKRDTSDFKITVVITSLFPVKIPRCVQLALQTN